MCWVLKSSETGLLVPDMPQGWRHCQRCLAKQLQDYLLGPPISCFLFVTMHPPFKTEPTISGEQACICLSTCSPFSPRDRAHRWRAGYEVACGLRKGRREQPIYTGASQESTDESRQRRPALNQHRKAQSDGLQSLTVS